MKFIITGFLFLLSPIALFAAAVSDRIEMGVSPIKNEFTVTPGVTTQRVITFYNNADIPYNIYLTAEDCTADSLVGTPKCNKSPNVIGDPLYFSTWVTFVGTKNLTIPPKSEAQVTVNINTPNNAVPGGRYGAVFFNRPTVSADNNTVKMVQRIGTLFLVTVPGTISYNTAYGTMTIGPGGGGGGGGGSREPSGVGVSSGYPAPKGTPEYWLSRISDILDPTLSAPTVPPMKDFAIDFKIPVSNKGNVHILPVGRIEIFDESGLPLKSIGKESIRSPEGAYVGERIVDYLPINDEGGNVLPNSDRLYQISWKGFAYETIEGGKSAIKFLSPQDYYKQLESEGSVYLLPWEKYRLIPVSKVLKANVYLEYSGEGNIPVPYEVEQDVILEYLTLEKSINYGAILILVGVLFLIWFIFFLRKRDRRIDILEEEVGYLEAEVDELEKGRMLARKALAKKIERNTTKEMIDARVDSEAVKKSPRKALVVKKKSSTKKTTDK